jgi:hypothetical protein
MSKPIGVSCALVVALLATVSVASAQTQGEGPVAPSAISLTGPSQPAPSAAPAVVVAAAAPAAPAAKEAPAEYAGNDHDLFVHHIAVGYFGISQLPVGSGGAASAIVNAPVVGLRYWATRLIGIDAGLGFGYATNSTNGTTGSNDTWGIALHGGLPLALADSKHFSFEVVPIEVTLGFTGGSIPTGGVMSTSLHGFIADVGARVGAELHFGFIGIPQLALEGSIGLLVKHQSWSSSAAGGGASPGGQSTGFATSVGSDPWAIFTDSISALYYF